MMIYVRLPIYVSSIFNHCKLQQPFTEGWITWKRLYFPLVLFPQHLRITSIILHHTYLSKPNVATTPFRSQSPPRTINGPAKGGLMITSWLISSPSPPLDHPQAFHPHMATWPRKPRVTKSEPPSAPLKGEARKQKRYYWRLTAWHMTGGFPQYIPRHS